MSLTVFSDRIFTQELNSLSASLTELIECSEFCSDKILEEKIATLLSEWKSSSVLLHSLILHEGMDQLEQNITALPMIAEHADRDLLRENCIEAINQIKNLLEAEKLSIENIL